MPDVASEKYMLPALLVPLRSVIPVLPLVAIVKSSALACPSVVVPINKRPLESMRTLSLPAVSTVNAVSYTHLRAHET